MRRYRVTDELPCPLIDGVKLAGAGPGQPAWRFCQRAGAADCVARRGIDGFTDSHALVLQSKARVSPQRRRFAGIMVDMFYDHLLARHWQQFSELPLAEFSQQSYRHLLQQRDIIPENAWPVIRHMSEHDWLTSYAQLPHLHRALDNMSKRLRRDNAMPGSVAELEADYAAFEQDFFRFMPQVQAFAADQAALLSSGAVDFTVPSGNPRA